jgi:hypothetical protein
MLGRGWRAGWYEKHLINCSNLHGVNRANLPLWQWRVEHGHSQALLLLLRSLLLAMLLLLILLLRPVLQDSKWHGNNNMFALHSHAVGALKHHLGRCSLRSLRCLFCPLNAVNLMTHSHHSSRQLLLQVHCEGLEVVDRQVFAIQLVVLPVRARVYRRHRWAAINSALELSFVTKCCLVQLSPPAIVAAAAHILTLQLLLHVLAYGW